MRILLNIKIILSLLLIITNSKTEAQVGVEWVHSYQTGRVSFGKVATAIDKGDNIYYLINYKDTVKRQVLYNEDSLFSSSNQMQIIKADPNGQIIWTKFFENATGLNLKIDGFSNILISGDFRGITDFDPDTNTNYLIKSDTIGSNADFLLKLDKDARFKWVNCIGGFALQNRALSVDHNNGIVWAGMFYGTVDFDPTSSTNLITGNFFDMYLQKFDSNGVVQFLNTYVSNGSNIPYGLDIDNLGEIIMTGVCDNIDFDKSSSTSPIQANANFLVKYDINGLYKWVRYLDVNATVINTSNFSNDIYIGGDFSGTKDFDNGVGVQNFSSTGGKDAFFMRLDSVAQFIWARTIGGSGNELAEVMDFKGSHLTVGVSFENSVLLNSSMLFSSNGSKDLMVITCDSSNLLVNADSYGSTGLDQFYSITISNSQTHFFTGRYENSIYFQPTNSLDAGTPYNFSNYFLAKANRFVIGLNNEKGFENEVNVYPNPTNGILTVKSDKNLRLVVYNSFGQVAAEKLVFKGSQTVSLNELPKGVYYFTFYQGQSKGFSRKVILLD